jgi:hypothetical protein
MAPRSTLAVTTIPAWGDGLVDAGFETVDQTNGDEFAIVGPTVILILNGSGGAALTVTLNLPASRHTANDARTKTFEIADTKIGVVKLDPGLYKQSDGNVYLDYSAGTATVAVCTVTPTPGIS